MIEIILEERYQRALNEKHQKELEKRVTERTKELSFEIKQRQKIESSLKKSEELFHTSFENKTIGVCLVHIDGSFMKVNAKLCKITGYNVKELLNMKFNDITHPEDAEVGYDYVNKLINEEIDYADFEKRYIHKDGRVIYAHISTAIVRNYRNEPEHFITYIQDLTAQKLANEALKVSEHNYQSLFENMTMGFAYQKMIYNGKGQAVDYLFLAVNQVFEELHQVSASTVIGKRALEVFPGVEKSWIKTCGKVAKTGKAIRTEIHNLNNNRYFEVKVYSPKIEHLAVIYSDITLKKKVELSLIESEEKFRTFFENP